MPVMSPIWLDEDRQGGSRDCTRLRRIRWSNQSEYEVWDGNLKRVDPQSGMDSMPPVADTDKETV
jgi:hypothetical protein